MPRLMPRSASLPDLFDPPAPALAPALAAEGEHAGIQGEQARIQAETPSTDMLRHPEHIHPALWRATQLASATARCVSTGHPQLNAELPGGGWPLGNLIELLSPQPGVGEMRLLRPALAGIERTRPIALVQPPHTPNHVCAAGWQMDVQQWLWVAPADDRDALWAAEKILKNGSCGALLLWQTRIRPESLRRLHLAAQGSDTLFLMLRPVQTADRASPAPLRLVLTPAAGGVDIHILKRRGPVSTGDVHLALDAPAPVFSPFLPYAPLDRPTPLPVAAGRVASAVAA